MSASPVHQNHEDTQACAVLSAVQKQRILVVDDDFEICRLVKAHITKTDMYDVHMARNRQEALALFVPGKYFAVLLDLHLGKSVNEGISLAAHIRSHDDNVFIAAISGYYPVFDERLLQCIDDFLKKPIDFDFLTSKLLMWQIKHARRIALKLYVEERVMSYKKCLAEILDEEELLKEQLHDLLIRTGFSSGGTSD